MSSKNNTLTKYKYNSSRLPLIQFTVQKDKKQKRIMESATELIDYQNTIYDFPRYGSLGKL